MSPLEPIDNSTAAAPKTPPKRRRRARRVVTWIVVAVAVWALAVLGLQRRVLYPRHLVNASSEAPSTGERLAISTPAGRGEAWYLPPIAPLAGAAPVLLFAHGNGELIGQWSEALVPYRRMGLGVLLIEYRGYGRAEGSPSQAAMTEDFIAVRDQVAARDEIDHDRFVYHGRSLGGGVVCDLATERPPHAIILESTFTSVPAIARRMGVPHFMVLDPYDNRAFLKGSPLPFLLLHGGQDRIIPVSHAHDLHAAAKNSRLHIFGDTGHNDGLFMRRDYWALIEDFLREQGIVRDRNPSPLSPSPASLKSSPRDCPWPDRRQGMDREV